MDSPTWVLEAQGVKKTYGTGESAVQALRGVDFQVGAASFAAIMGPSGSGKSTLLHLLGGLDRPTAGCVLLEGVDMAALDENRRTLLRRSRIGFVFQSFNLVPALTALENVSIPLELGGVPAREARRRAEEMLDLVDMSDRCRHVPSALSGGQQQLVAIARALALRPALLLADEPTGNLDSEHGAQVIAMLRKLVDEERQTVVMVTHDADVAAQADRTIRIRDGRVETRRERK